MKRVYICPVCREDMTNPSGNIHICPNCDYTATENQLSSSPKR